MKRIALFTAFWMCSFAAAQTAPAPAGFTASTEAVAINYAGEWSAGNHTTESFDLIDFGATKATHLYLEGHEIMAPTPGFQIYAGGVKIEPDLSKLISKTNVKAGSFGVFLSGGIGVGIPSTGNSQIGWLAGGGIKYQITNELAWQSLQANYGGIGAQRFAAISTGLSYFFGKH